MQNNTYDPEQHYFMLAYSPIIDKWYWYCGEHMGNSHPCRRWERGIQFEIETKLGMHGVKAIQREMLKRIQEEDDIAYTRTA